MQTWTKAPIASRQAGLAPSAEFRRNRSHPCASCQPHAKGPAPAPRGPGKWPQAGSEEPFPKARLTRNAHFICLFICLLLTGKRNTKANYLIKALGRVLMSQTSKQISKPLFCLRLQRRGHAVGAGQVGTAQGAFTGGCGSGWQCIGTGAPSLCCGSKRLSSLFFSLLEKRQLPPVPGSERRGWEDDGHVVQWLSREHNCVQTAAMQRLLSVHNPCAFSRAIYIWQGHIYSAGVKMPRGELRCRGGAAYREHHSALTGAPVDPVHRVGGARGPPHSAQCGSATRKVRRGMMASWDPPVPALPEGPLGPGTCIRHNRPRRTISISCPDALGGLKLVMPRQAFGLITSLFP